MLFLALFLLGYCLNVTSEFISILSVIKTLIECSIRSEISQISSFNYLNFLLSLFMDP